MKTVTATGLRNTITDVLGDVEFNDEIYIVFRYKKPVAVMLSKGYYDWLTRKCAEAEGKTP